MLDSIKSASLASRFLLELCALGALGYWGFKPGGGTIAKVGVPAVLSLLPQVMIFGLAAASLAATGHPRLPWVFVAVVAINAILMYVWEQ